MATTTNYSWTTPDDTGLVKDGASAIRSLGTAIDTTTKNLNPSTTLGDIEYRSSTANTNTRLPIGTTGQVLTVSGGVPAWGSVSGGGKVLQVVQATSSTATTVASTTMTDSGLSVTITPTLSSSKVLILVSQGLLLKRNSDRAKGGWRLMRGATEIFNGDDGFFILANLGGNTYQTWMQGYYALNYLDTPSTTSATTYKTQINVDVTTDSAAMVGQGENGVTSSIIALEIGA
jgi:hypothetical protein